MWAMRESSSELRGYAVSGDGGSSLFLTTHFSALDDHTSLGLFIDLTRSLPKFLLDALRASTFKFKGIGLEVRLSAEGRTGDFDSADNRSKSLVMREARTSGCSPASCRMNSTDSMPNELVSRLCDKTGQDEQRLGERGDITGEINEHVELSTEPARFDDLGDIFPLDLEMRKKKSRKMKKYT